MTIIIDSNFIFAIKAEQDKYHKRALEIFSDLQESYKKSMLTNYLVINETLTLAIARSKADISFIEKIYELVWGQETFFKTIQLTSEEYKAVYNVLKKYCTTKRLLSFVDASLLYLYKKHKAEYILSFDSHFDEIATRKY